MEVDAQLRSIEAVEPPVLRLIAGETRFRATLAHGAPAPPGGLSVDSVVRIRGVYGSIVNEKGQLVGLQLFVPSWDDVKVIRRPPEAREEVPFTQIGSLRRYSPGGISAARARVRGVVSFVSADRLYVEDSTGGIAIPWHERPVERPGDVVEASGYVGIDGLQLVLDDAQVRKMGTAPLQPVRLSAMEALGGSYSGRLVTIGGYVLERGLNAGSQSLILIDGGQVFSASLDQGQGSNTVFGLEKDTLVAVTGVCVVSSQASASTTLPKALQIRMRTPADVVTVRRAPWWSATRTWAALAVMTGCAGFVLFWAALLRRRVRQQNRHHSRPVAQGGGAQVGGRSGQPRQERVSGPHEPRGPHSPQRHLRHDGVADGQPLERRAAQLSRHGEAVRGQLAHDHQRYPRSRQDRSRQAEPRFQRASHCATR